MSPRHAPEKPVKADDDKPAEEISNKVFILPAIFLLLVVGGPIAAFVYDANTIDSDEAFEIQKEENLAQARAADERAAARPAPAETATGAGGEDGDPDTIPLVDAVAFADPSLADSICDAFAAGADFDDIVREVDRSFEPSMYEFNSETYTYTLAYGSCPGYLEVQP